MFIGFELKKLTEKCFPNFEKYFQIGNQVFENSRKEVKKTLNIFINEDGSIDGDRMQSYWFPKINADIFLSHSHKDEKLIIAFAGWLKDIFNLDVFIDSCIWGYSNDLQKIIDNKYNKIGDNLYKHQKVLYASSHVNMMLNSALMQMIDNCECIMFINTPNSVKTEEVIDKIVSPWIYSELGMSKLIKKKSINEHRIQELHESTQVFSDFTMEYRLDTEHLIPIDIDDLNNWKKKYNNNRTRRGLESSHDINLNALNTLYKLKEM
jgi:hypothetical protein